MTNIIKKLRIERKMTQQELAEYLNVSRNTVTMWELSINTPPTEKIKELAKIFSVTTDLLINSLIPDNNTEKAV